MFMKTYPRLSYMMVIQKAPQWAWHIFKFVDTNGDRYISMAEVNAFIELQIPDKELRASDTQFRKMFDMLDFNKDGLVH